MIIKKSPERAPFVAYTLALALGALLMTIQGVKADPALVQAYLGPVALFSLFIGLAWRFTFTILPRARMSMDFVFIIAALAVLPPPLPYLVGAGATLLGMLLRRGESPNRRPGLALTALNAGVLFTMIGVGSLTTAGLGRAWNFHPVTWDNILAVGLIFVILTFTNVLLLAGAIHQRGRSALHFAQHYLRYISATEVFAIPLIVALIALYVHTGVLPFLCLGSSLLLASWLFNRLNQVEEGLRKTNQNLTDRTAELAALNSIAKEVSSSLDPTLVCRVVSQHCHKVLPDSCLFITTADPESSEITFRFLYRNGKLLSDEKLPLGSGFFQWALKTRRPLLVKDLAEEGKNLPFPPVIHDPSVRSILLVPLVVDNRGTGVMGMTDSRPGVFDLHRLSALTTIAQQAAVAIENARHYQLATVDQLTRLYLRHHFLQKLSDERTRAQRYRSPFAILMLDLDRFKEVNDSKGHSVGDRLLRQAADAIQRSLRSSDIACRWGGDEFCVLLPQTDISSAHATAERILNEIAGLARSMPDLRTTASVGIATYPNDFDGELPELLRRADLALYRAKHAGRNRVAIFSRPNLSSSPPKESEVSLLPR